MTLFSVYVYFASTIEAGGWLLSFLPDCDSLEDGTESGCFVIVVTSQSTKKVRLVNSSHGTQGGFWAEKGFNLSRSMLKAGTKCIK